MKKLYVVNIRESFIINLGIMAESEEEAEEKATQLFADGKYEKEFFESSHGVEINLVSSETAEFLIDEGMVIIHE